MKCFLHIGTEKTATTTIQSFLDLNRSKLLRNGFIYTASAGKTNNRNLSVAAYNLDRRDDFTQHNGIYLENELSAFQKQTICELKKEIEEKTNHNSDLKIIFSSEHFQSRLTKIEEIKKLKEILYAMGISDIYVIVYLRNPAEIAKSLFSTAVKAGSIKKRPPLPSNIYWANICNHKDTLKLFSSVFGESALIPKLFDKNEFQNESIIDDFLKIIGAPIINNPAYSIPNNENKSLSATGIEILRRINKIIPVFIDNKHNELRKNIVSYIEKYFSDDKYVMPRYLYEQYDLEFQESNEWVRKKYFPDKKTLFHATYREETISNMPDTELDRMANLISDIWIDKQNRIIELTNQMHSDRKKPHSFLAQLFASGDLRR